MRFFSAVLSFWVLSLCVLAIYAEAEVKTKDIEYEENGVKLKGTLAWDDRIQGKRPGVLVVHEWWGINDHVRGRAKELAALGYAAFALDMYGSGINTDHPEKAGEMMNQLKNNEKLLLSRAYAGLNVLKNSEYVDADKLAAIGYCFGGYVILKMAYDGADLKSLATFHAALAVPKDTSKIKGRILVCHGREDTFIPEKDIKEFKAAMDKGGVQYKFISYPDAVHGFTVKGSEKRGIKGIGYNEKADKDSWEEMKTWFEKSFPQAAETPEAN